MPNQAVSVIIPTYNNFPLLKRFLPSVLAMLRSGDELVVTDDASTDETIDWLIKKFHLKKIMADRERIIYQNKKYQLSPKKPQKTKMIDLVLIANQKNQRFAANVNQAVKIAQHNLIFLLNSDVKPQPNVLQMLTRQFTEKSNHHLFAVSCLEYEGQTQSSAKAGKNRLWYELGLFQHSKAIDFHAGPTAWASGGSALFDKTKWLQLGGFDLKFYPAYWEDVDLSFRARRHGWQILFEPKAVVFHQHDSTHRQIFNQKAMLKLGWRHADYFTLKHGDFWQRLAYYLWRPFWWFQRRKLLNQLKHQSINQKETGNV